MRPFLTAALTGLALLSPALAQQDPAPEPVYKLGDLVPQPDLAIEEFGIPSVGEAFRIQLREGPPASQLSLFLRAADPDSMVEVWSADDATAIGAGTDAQGFASVALPIPVDLQPGLLFDFQWAGLDPRTNALLRSEVLRVRVLDADVPLHVEYDASVAMTVSGLEGGSGGGQLEGVVRVNYFPGASDDELLAEVVAVRLDGPSVPLDNGLESGDLQLRLLDAVQVPIHYSSGLQVELDAGMRLFAGVLDPSYPEPSEYTGSYVDVYGVFLAGRSGPSGSLGFGSWAPDPGDTDASTTLVDFGGSLLDQEEFCVLGDTFKVALEITVTVIKDGAGVPTWTPQQVQAALDKVNDIWCMQCCIRIDQAGNTQFQQSPNFVDINYGERQAVHNANKGNGIFEVFLTGSLTGSTTGATVGYRSADPTIFVGQDGNTNTLAHEIGHLLNMSDWRDAANIMNGQPNAAKRKLTKRQCDFARTTKRVKEDFSPCEQAPEG